MRACQAILHNLSFDFGLHMNNTGFPCDQYITKFYLELLRMQHYFPETWHENIIFRRSTSLPISISPSEHALYDTAQYDN